jgi:hypothetical protein
MPDAPHRPSSSSRRGWRLAIGYAILLAACAGFVALRFGDDLLTTASLEFGAALTLWSAVWASWCAPDKGPARLGSVFLVNCIAHAAFFFALIAELPHLPREGCGLGSLAFIFYPGIAIFMIVVALILTAIGTFLVRCMRQEATQPRAASARVVDSIK